jgi:transcriptional regulator GlxA family with amidase domain
VRWFCHAVSKRASDETGHSQEASIPCASVYDSAHMGATVGLLDGLTATTRWWAAAAPRVGAGVVGDDL